MKFKGFNIFEQCMKALKVQEEFKIYVLKCWDIQMRHLKSPWSPKKSQILKKTMLVITQLFKIACVKGFTFGFKCKVSKNMRWCMCVCMASFSQMSLLDPTSFEKLGYNLDFKNSVHFWVFWRHAF